MVTVALPVAGESFGGDSFAPRSSVVKIDWTAAAGVAIAANKSPAVSMLNLIISTSFGLWVGHQLQETLLNVIRCVALYNSPLGLLWFCFINLARTGGHGRNRATFFS